MKDTLKGFFEGKKNILLAFLFGSAAKNQMTHHSDIDIGILFKKNPDFFESNELRNELEAILGKDVDIAVLNNASPVLKMQVLKKGNPLYIKERRCYNEFFVDTVNQYYDLKRIRKVCEDGILKGRIYA